MLPSGCPYPLLSTGQCSLWVKAGDRKLMGAVHISSQDTELPPPCWWSLLQVLLGLGNCPFACIFVHSSCPETSHCDVNIPCVQCFTLWVEPATLILADTSRLSPQSLNVPQQRLPNSLGCLRAEIPAAAPGWVVEPLNDTMRWMSLSPHERWRNRSQQWHDFKKTPSKGGIKSEL